MEGGFAFGLGEVSVATTSTGAFPTTAPGTTVRANRLMISPHTLNGEDIAELGVSGITLDDNDILLYIDSSNTVAPATVFNRKSLINPVLGHLIQRDAAFTVTLSNAGSSGAIVSAGAVRCHVDGDPRGGVEGTTPSPGPVLGAGRYLALGASSDTGASRSGTPNSTRDLLLYHLVIQAVSDALLVSAVQLDDQDFLTGGTAPSEFFDEEAPLFSYKGARIDKSTTVTVTTTSGAAGQHCEGITARAV
tara:strand:- start:1777 stop:2520 length:744 start_codon:yes stop_codon:yes gene_type:complete